MKKIAFILILFVWRSSFSQNLSKDSINTISVDHFFNELIKPGKLTIQDCRYFGDSIARFDFAKGNKRILRHIGMFTTSCMTCIYNKYGYESYDFASNDVLCEYVDAFVEMYNKSMLSHLPIDAQNELKNPRPFDKLIFSTYLTTLVSPNIQRLTDTTLNLRLYSDTLEYLFKRDIDSLKISINYQIQSTDSVEYSYQKLKINGITINDNKQDILKIYITFDFKNMPTNYEICWCPVLEQKYRLMLPIKLK